MSELVCKTLELLAENKGSFTSAIKNIFNTKTMATLKISDLSVGDWVEYRDREWQVCSLYQFTGEVGLLRKDSQICENVADCEPIPLTPEILDKNGFRLVVVNKKFNDWHDNNITIRKYYNEDNYHLFVCGQKIAFKMLSVHQLQHALRLAGGGKEIEI